MATQSGPSFYSLKPGPAKPTDKFYKENAILQNTIEAVNSFYSQYQTSRVGVKGGPATHAQQDLYRAMLVFACAGLDVFIKQLAKESLPELVKKDKKAQEKFQEYIKRGLKKDEKQLLNTVALALISETPRDLFIRDYVNSLTGDSLQSVDELRKVSDAAGLDTKKIFDDAGRANKLRDAFEVRNEIVHEMDITVAQSAKAKQGYRSRRQRQATTMEAHTKAMLDLAQDFFDAFQDKYKALGI